MTTATLINAMQWVFAEILLNRESLPNRRRELMYAPALLALGLSVLLSLVPVEAQSLREPKSATHELPVGFIASFTGQYARLAGLMASGAELALNDCNERLRERHYSLRLVPEDDNLVDNKTTLAIVKKFRAVDRPIAILAWAFSTAAPIKAALSGSHIPVLFFWDSNQEIPKMGANFYGTGPSIPLAAAVIANHSLATPNATIGSLSLIDAWSERMNSALKEELVSRGSALSATESLLYDNTDFRTPIVRLKRSGAKHIAVFAYGSALVTAVKQLRQVWPDVHIYAVGMPESDMRQLGSSAEGMLVVNGWATGLLAERLSNHIVRRQQSALPATLLDLPALQKTPPTPTELAYGLYAYTSSHLVCMAVEKALSERLDISAQVVNTKLREVHFDAGVGDIAPGRYNTISERLLEWRQGAFQPVALR